MTSTRSPGCGTITGDLTITAPGVLEFALPLLEMVGGNISIQGNTGLRRLRLPALVEVGGNVFADLRAPIGGADLSRLKTTDGGVDLRSEDIDLNLPCLESTYSLRALEWQDGALVYDRIAIPRVRSIGLYIVGDFVAPVLETLGVGVGGALVAPVLTTVGGGVDATPVDAPSLSEIGGNLLYRADVQLPALERAGGITLLDAPVVDLPALREIAGTLAGGLVGSSGCTGTPRQWTIPRWRTSSAARGLGPQQLSALDDRPQQPRDLRAYLHAGADRDPEPHQDPCARWLQISS